MRRLCVVYRAVCALCRSADIMVGMGYSRESIQESLARMKYDEITATYLLLGRKSSEVRDGWGPALGELLYQKTFLYADFDHCTRLLTVYTLLCLMRINVHMADICSYIHNIISVHLYEGLMCWH